MLVSGGAWVLFISLIGALVQNLAPDWVRARVLAVFILVYQGSFALGSAAWGAVAQRAGIRFALVAAGLGTIATTVLALFAALPDSPGDLSPWNHWRIPAIAKDNPSDLDQGPVLVTVEYTVIPAKTAEFIDAVHQYSRIRRRDGAYSWGIFHDTESANRYLETFLVHSWAEHLRQHDRETQADYELERHLRTLVSRDTVVHHLIYSHSKET
jgi:MFS family permease